MIWLLAWCFCGLLVRCFHGTPNSVSRCVFDSFACFGDYFPPVGLPYPASIWGLLPCLTVSYSVVFEKKWQGIHQLNEALRALMSLLGFRSLVLHVVVGSWSRQNFNLMCRGSKWLELRTVAYRNHMEWRGGSWNPHSLKKYPTAHPWLLNVWDKEEKVFQQGFAYTS